MVSEGRKRVIIEKVKPEIDGGRFPIKRVVGEKVVVEADVFADGHDELSCVLRYRKEGDSRWSEVWMELGGNDRWRGEFVVEEIGRYCYTVEGWVDRFKSWRRDAAKKLEAGQDVAGELLVGAKLIEEASGRARKGGMKRLQGYATVLREARELSERVAVVMDEELAELMREYGERRLTTRYERELAVVVDRERARFSSWYELFPRSCGREAGRHGSFKDCMERLGYVASMGFNVVYLPPIHPIGTTHRKGRNNAAKAGKDDPGSPWAIGSKEGGHKAIHGELGTVEEFRELVEKAKEYGMEIALDLAYQCSPDHPYVKEHPGWFRWRPDGTLQYAENPPKKYEDIYPFDFETEDWEELWKELKSVVEFWIEQGVRIFRVDNPHTKPFCFWEWLISEIKREYPEVLFLAEAFTRPKVMYYLAKLGFTQSYTYFAWRNTKWELSQYFSELTQMEVSEYYRAHLWPNTPDILTEYLQTGGRAAFMARLILAATLGANYGIYGPAFELCEHQPREHGGEEYLDSEKYELKGWAITRRDSLREFIGRVNRIRRENPALQRDKGLRFHEVDNEQLMCYSKATEDRSNVVVVVVNLDPHHTHSGWVELKLEELGLEREGPYQLHDELSEARYLWSGARNYVELNPHVVPAHIFRVRRRVRREQDFDYYM